MPIDRKYTGYRDTDSEGFTGISAAIDYVKPQSVCYQTNTWIGTDNVSSMIWAQIGWAYEIKPSKRVADYAEVHRHDGGYNIYYFTPIESGAVYKIEKASGEAVWNIGGKQVHSESWAGIVGSDVMPNAQYTVEVFDPACDYVPGSNTDKNYYTDIQTRATGGSFGKAALATDQTNDPNGEAEKNTGSGNMWMAVWDKRAETEMKTDNSHSSTIESKEPSPSVIWREAIGRGLTEARAEEVTNALIRHSRSDVNAIEAAPVAVEVTDAFSFGAPGVHMAHRISLADVTVSHEEENASAQVDLELFLDPENQGIVSAATRSKPHWAAASAKFAPADPEAELQKIGINALFDPASHPNLTVEDVLTAIWRDMGISPEEAGHVVMRPRIIVPTYPKIMKHGEMAPERPAGLYWIVEVRGTVLKEIVAPSGERVGHQTGMVILVDDRVGDAFYGIGLP